MIISRYIQRSIHLGTLAALLVLVSLSLFFLLVRELDDIGQGDYGLLQALMYVALSAPARVVEFMPLAALLGSMLSLGALAGNSEVIAMQASGVSQNRLLASVLQAGLVLALCSFLLGDWVVPDSESAAHQGKNQALDQTTALRSSRGLWIKDETRVVHIDRLLPNGAARDVAIYELDDNGKLVATLLAARALPVEQGWELRQVQRSEFTANSSRSQYFKRLPYPGNLSVDLLRVMMIEPRQMSSMDLYAYTSFLEENGLDARVEHLVFWQKMLAPATVVIMCLLAFPFVLGSQRNANTGQRLLFGILLGLAFVVLERLLTQLGGQLEIDALLIALLPNLIFLGLAFLLLAKRQSHGLASRRAAVAREP